MATQLAHDVGGEYVNQDFESDSGDEMLAVHFDQELLNDNKFTCPECQYNCNSSYLLKRHKLKHSNVRPYKCKMCKYAAKDEVYLKLHYGRMHNNLPSHGKFSLPSKVLKEKNLCLKGILQNLPPVQYVCVQCNKNNESLKKLKSHIRRHLTENIHYTCDLCHQKFEEFRRVKKHILTHVDTVRHKYSEHHYMTRRSSDCQQNLRSERSSLCATVSPAYEEKVLTIRKDSTDKSDKNEHNKSLVRMYTCELCGFSHETFNSLEKHLLRHLGKNIVQKGANSTRQICLHKLSAQSFRCEQCGFSCEMFNTLKKHLQSHSKRGIHKKQTTTCTSKTVQNVDQTSMTQLHKCHLCGFSCKMFEMLKEHLLRHVSKDVHGLPAEK